MLDARHSEPFAALKGKPAARLAGKLPEEYIINFIERRLAQPVPAKAGTAIST